VVKNRLSTKISIFTHVYIFFNIYGTFGNRSFQGINNLAGIHPQKVGELMTLLRNWQERTKAPIPVELNPYHTSEKNETTLKKYK
jgi:hypothetical protein